MDDGIADIFEAVRPELTAYLCRLVVRPHVAEELAQTAFVRIIESGGGSPDSNAGIRAWLFRVATNLAIDELRRHSTWRESTVADLRAAAETSPEFVARSEALVGTPETKTIAREHLAACFACVLRNLPERRAAALLLREVHGFTLNETAGMLEATEGQVKNWLKEARAHMHDRYRETCALIAKQGVCYQCVELDQYFAARQGSPLSAGDDHITARTEVLKELRTRPWGKWHTSLLSLLDDLQ